jgi:hypothetical protein
MAKVFRKTTGLEMIAKRIDRYTVGLRTVKDWTLWRGRPPPKRKQRQCGTPATLDSFSPPLERKRTEEFDVWTPGMTGTFLGKPSERAAALKDGAV